MRAVDGVGGVFQVYRDVAWKLLHDVEGGSTWPEHGSL